MTLEWLAPLTSPAAHRREMLYWLFKSVMFGPFLRLLFRPKIVNRHNFPKKGAAIMASNHLSFSDSFFLPVVAPRRITFLAKSEYFNGKGLKGLISKAFFTGVGQVPIDRSGGRASEAAVQTAIGILKQGKLLGIYPEGTRSPDGRLYRGRTGIVRIAIEAGVPIVPVAMIGTFEIQPIGKVMPRIKKVKVAYGEALDFTHLKEQVRDPAVLRDCTNQVMQAIQALSGQEYVDIYATKAKELLADGEIDAAVAVEIADSEEN
jgi:1-acyl-sn-glycerol-3-phosphate acyltransferase